MLGCDGGYPGAAQEPHEEPARAGQQHEVHEVPEVGNRVHR